VTITAVTITAEPLALSLTGVKKCFQPSASFGELLRGKLRRPPVVALHGVDLAIAPGAFVGLVGPNGAGKSTLLRIAAGLVLPDEGVVSVFGLLSERDDAAFRRRVGYAVSDERSHFWRLSGRENLRFFAALQGVPEARADEALADVQLEAAAGRAVREYSTGMRQRLALARALLGDPEVLLLDEPTRGLDPGSAARFRRFVQDELVDKRRKTVLYATHDLLEMRSLCPELIAIGDGRLLDRGPWDRLEAGLASLFGETL
jgi:ABC-2 type transport system ATP-binding protein